MHYKCSVCGDLIEITDLPGERLPDFVRCPQNDFPNCSGWAVPFSKFWPVRKVS